MTYELSRSVQNLNINKTLAASCMKCSYKYVREDIDQIEEGIFDHEISHNQRPVHVMFDQLMSGTEMPKNLQLTESTHMQNIRNVKVAGRPSKQLNNTPSKPQGVPKPKFNSAKRPFSTSSMDTVKPHSAKTTNKKSRASSRS